MKNIICLFIFTLGLLFLDRNCDANSSSIANLPLISDITGIVNSQDKVDIYFDHQNKPALSISLQDLSSFRDNDSDNAPVAFGNFKISEDSQHAGIEVRFKNCCTSYPITRALLIIGKNKNQQTIELEAMIYDWAIQSSSKVFVEYGPTHGFCFANRLYDIETGKMDAEIFCDEKGQPESDATWITPTKK